MKVKDYIDTFRLEHDHPYEDSVILKWINLVESNVFGEIIKDYAVQKYAKVFNEYQYDLPENVDFTDVVALFISGVKYNKKDVRAYRERYAYWFEDGKLNIYPACSDTDEEGKQSIRLVYINRPSKKLLPDIETDELTIPDRFIEIYDYFILHKIAYLEKDYAEAQNHITMYNIKVADFERWWENHRPQKPEHEIIFQEEGDSYSVSDFDRE